MSDSNDAIKLGDMFPEEDKDNIDRQKKILKQLADEGAKETLEEKEREDIAKQVAYDLSKVSDVNYLNDIFSSKFDKYKSKEYLNKTRQKLLKAGHVESPILNEYLFWLTISRRLHILYQKMHTELMKHDSSIVQSENLNTLKSIGLVSDRVAKLQETLEVARLRKEKVADVVDIFSETMKSAEAFIKENAGEYSFRCKQCGTIVQADGLPHYAIMMDKDDKDDNVYLVYSPEAIYLVKKNIIPMHAMAFILRTSIEGIMYTAKLRKDNIKDLLKNVSTEDEEKMLKDTIKEFRDENEGNI